MADIVEISRMLADRAQAVAEMLLPQGRRDGQEWRAGSVHGDKGQSLGVHLAGEKAGVWTDFADPSKGGDLLDLWREARGLSLSAALDEARTYLGVTRPQPFHEPKRSYDRPRKPNCRKVEGRARDYLTEDRNIPGHILDSYKVACSGENILFPYILPDGEVAMIKSRHASDGAAPKPTTSNCEPILFGWQAMPDDAREIIITEGEIDALSWASFGFPAMSVPFGGGKGAKQRWIESEYDRFERFEKIYISTDMDKPGQEAAEEIVSRLGRHRCVRVVLPVKDANQCLVDGKSAAEMKAYLDQAIDLDPEGLRRTIQFTDAVIDLFWPEEGVHPGYTMPYRKLRDHLHFRPAELTLWSGASGSGKSQIISDCIPHWIKEGSRVCLASFEMKGAQTLRRMVKQTGGRDRPTPDFIRHIIGYLDQGLLIYERVGKSGVSELLSVFEYARAKYGCDQFVIDSLMRLGIAADDYNGQEKAVFQIVDWCIKNNVHIHLVAHARKSAPGQGAPETEDVKGASEIGSNAFNILTIWRNKKLEDDSKREGTASEESEEDEDAANKPGVILNVAKQRNGDFSGKVGLWFDQDTYRYQSSHDRSQWDDRRYLPIGIIGAAA